MIYDWKPLNQRIDRDYGIFTVRTHQAVSPRTDAMGEFYTIDSGNWVNVIPLTAQKEVVMIRQYRHGTQRVSLEIPGGVVDETDPAKAAVRELAEETGYEGSRVTLLGSVSPNPALFTNRCYTYLVEDVEKRYDLCLDANEDIEVELVPLRGVPALIECGALDHALVVAAFQFYFQKYGFPGTNGLS
jgi:ADP-ribose pyrophosphatase